MVLFGIDAHADYQPGLNVDAVKAEGFSFLVAKATEGTGYVAQDRNFTWVRRAKQIGLVTGMYHVLRAGNGAAQARAFHQQLQRVGGHEGLLIQLDCEFDGDADELPGWVDEWNRLTVGHPFLIYTGSWWWRPVMGNYSGARHTPLLWHSSYVNGTGTASGLFGQVPESWWSPGYGGWPSATFLQFSSTASAAGVPRLDVNAFRGTEAQLRALTGSHGGPAPTPPPSAATSLGDDPMRFLVQQTGQPAIYLADGLVRRWVRDDEDLANLRLQATNGTMSIWHNGEIIPVPTQALLDAWGALVGDGPAGPTPAVVLTDAQLAAITMGVDEAVGERFDGLEAKVDKAGDDAAHVLATLVDLTGRLASGAQANADALK